MCDGVMYVLCIYMYTYTHVSVDVIYVYNYMYTETLAYRENLFHKLKKIVKVGAHKQLRGLLTTLFVVRVAQIGQLQRWGGIRCPT